MRKYQNRPVDKSILEKIIDAGRMAPSAINVQPWKFYVIHNRGLILLCAKAILQVTAKEFLKGGPLKVLKESIHLLKFTHGIRFIKAVEDYVKIKLLKAKFLFAKAKTNQELNNVLQELNFAEKQMFKSHASLIELEDNVIIEVRKDANSIYKFLVR